MSDHEIGALLRERENVYGNFAKQAAIASDLKGILRAYCNWDDHFTADQREALDFIMTKIARAVNGDPNHVDGWRDIEGYARLIAERLSRT